MVEWVTVWLENPEAFPAWAEARKPRLEQGEANPAENY